MEVGSDIHCVEGQGHADGNIRGTAGIVVLHGESPFIDHRKYSGNQNRCRKVTIWSSVRLVKWSLSGGAPQRKKVPATMS